MRLLSSSKMSSNVLCLSRTSFSTVAPRRSARSYCWSKRYRSSFNCYPSSSKHVENARRPNPSYTGWITPNKSGRNLGSYRYRTIPHRGWRWASSWARYKAQWEDFERKHRSKDREDGGDSRSMFRVFDQLEKDSEEMYRMIKNKIEADPFDALFGRSSLYPNRATWWNSSNKSKVPEAEQQRNNSRSKPNENTEANGEQLSKNESHASAVSSRNTASLQSAFPPVTGTTADMEFDSHDFIIDPITMRKVQRQPTNKSSGTPPPREDSEQSCDIPVKRFKGDTQQQPKSRPSKDESFNSLENENAQAKVTGHRPAVEEVTHEWPAQETSRPSQHNNTTAQFNDPAVTSSKPSSSFSSDSKKPYLSYDAKETRIDDVDLLRPSDIRAASGLRGRPRRESENQKDERRKELEARFKEVSESNHGWQEQREFQEERARNAKLQAREELEREYLEREKSAQKSAMAAMETREAEFPMSNVHSITAQPEQAEGDMAANVHEFASRERWYKRKAPHATELENQKISQSEKDRSFIQEIRGIYEEKYGVIDTKHRQPGVVASHTEIQEPDVDRTSAQPPNHKTDLSEKSLDETSKNVLQTGGPLSMQEKIGTLMQQLLDDSRHLQKLLRTSESSPDVHEEVFHRNRSIRNASDAITEALSSISPKSDGSLPMQATKSGDQIAMDRTYETSQAEQPFAESQKSTTLYNVLAYDPSNQQVTTAEMSSPGEAPSERRLSLSEALSSLTEPAKFLPHLTGLQTQGYEIVSSDTNILVLRKTHKAPAAPSQPSPPSTEKIPSDREERHKMINPIDGTTTQTGNFASPTGFVNHDSVLPHSEFESDDAGRNLSGYKVHRKEDVFSGPSGKRWENNRFGNRSDATDRKASYRRSKRRRRTSKRMIWVGLWTAGCCYAMGAMTEYLRT